MSIIKNHNKSRKRKSAFRRVSEWLHLWLGLFSGIIVFVICLTGALWVFRHEVWYFTERYQQVEPRRQTTMLPSHLIANAKEYLAIKEKQTVEITSITYGLPTKAVAVDYNLKASGYGTIYLNPYLGNVIMDKRGESAAEKFFIFVRAGHRFLWLPKEIGSPLVGASCLIFVITLITGVIWWLPVKWNSKTRKKSFGIKWKANWKRVNIDLHNVLGFYAVIFVLVLTVTGIVFTFKWFENGIYKILTWKNPAAAEITQPLSDTTLLKSANRFHPEDILWKRMNSTYNGKIGRLVIDFPAKAEDPYQVIVLFGDGTIIYNKVLAYYDQYSLQQIKTNKERLKPYAHLSTGEKVFRMNFDIHTGQILGLPTKIIAFFACIIGASLPVTGFIIWYNRKWGKRKRPKNVNNLVSWSAE